MKKTAGTDTLFDFEPTHPAPAAVDPRPATNLPTLRPDGQFACAICGDPAHFGFGVELRKDKPGRWACSKHKDQVKNLIL